MWTLLDLEKTSLDQKYTDVTTLYLGKEAIYLHILYIIIFYILYINNIWLEYNLRKVGRSDNAWNSTFCQKITLDRKKVRTFLFNLLSLVKQRLEF